MWLHTSSPVSCELKKKFLRYFFYIKNFVPIFCDFFFWNSGVFFSLRFLIVLRYLSFVHFGGKWKPDYWQQVEDHCSWPCYTPFFRSFFGFFSSDDSLSVLFPLAATWWRTRSAWWNEELSMTWRSWRGCENRRLFSLACARPQCERFFWFLSCSLCCCCLFPAAVAWTRTASASCQSCCSRRTKRWPDCKSAKLPLLCLNFCRVVAAHKWLEDWDIRPQTQLVLFFQLDLSFGFCSYFGCVIMKSAFSNNTMSTAADILLSLIFLKLAILKNSTQKWKQLQHRHAVQCCQVWEDPSVFFNERISSVFSQFLAQKFDPLFFFSLNKKQHF